MEQQLINHKHSCGLVERRTHFLGLRKRLIACNVLNSGAKPKAEQHMYTISLLYLKILKEYSALSKVDNVFKVLLSVSWQIFRVQNGEQQPTEHVNNLFQDWIIFEWMEFWSCQMENQMSNKRDHWYDDSKDANCSNKLKYLTFHTTFRMFQKGINLHISQQIKSEINYNLAAIFNDSMAGKRTQTQNFLIGVLTCIV